MKILKSFSIVAILTLLSSLLGYLREATLASEYGATAITDAFFAAFFIPNTLYLILLSGSISTVFVPVFIEYLGKDRDQAWYLASNLFNISALLLFIIILICILSVDYWVAFLFPGFEKATMKMVVDLVIILMPMLLFVGLSSLISSILHSFEHFSTPALAPIVSNLFVIIVILYSHKLGGIYAVAFGVTIGMLLQILIQFPALYRKNAKYRLVMGLGHPALKRIGKLSIPLMIYLLIAYVSLIIERNLASTLPEGTISSLNYAVRVFSIPVAFTAGSVGTVIYPRLSLDVARHESATFSQNVFRSITASLFFLAPISLWLILNSRIAISLLFGYGRFTPEDVTLTSAILIGYSIGMVATGISRILQRASYALQDTSSPLWAEIGTLILYVATAPLLTRYLGGSGLGIARGISFIIVMFVLIWLLKRKHNAILFSLNEVFVVIGKYSFASLLAVATFNLAWLYSLPLFESRTGSFLKTIIFLGLSTVIYLLIGYLLKFSEIQFICEKLLPIKNRLARSWWYKND